MKVWNGGITSSTTNLARVMHTVGLMMKQYVLNLAIQDNQVVTHGVLTLKILSRVPLTLMGTLLIALVHAL